MSGSGTFASPWDLATALNNGMVGANDTLLLRGGTYTGNVATNIKGKANNLVTIKPYPGEHVIISGEIMDNSSYVIWEDIEITDTSYATRDTPNPGSVNPWGYSSGIESHAPGSKYINCVIHDIPDNGIGWMEEAIGSFCYGCLIYYNGWQAPDRGHGHGLYVQNKTDYKTISNCVIHNNFETGFKFYGSAEAHLNNLLVYNNTSYCNNGLYLLPGTINHSWNFMIGGYGDVHSVDIRNNTTFHIPGAGKQKICLGINTGGHLYEVKMVDNYFVEGWGNEHNEDEGMPNGDLRGMVTFSEFSGNYVGPAVGDVVYVRPNDYKVGRANITIYNQALANTVDVDLSSVTGLSIGDHVYCHNTMDYFVDIQNLTLSASKKITVDMQAAHRTIAVPNTWTAPATTYPQFGAFIIEKV